MHFLFRLQAEGLQSYFDENWCVEEADGNHNEICTREKLKDYDPTLHALIKELFPCENTLLHRCGTTRGILSVFSFVGCSGIYC